MLFYTLDTLIYLTDVLFSKIHLFFKKKNSMFQWFQQPNYFYILYNLETKSYVITICIHASFCICVYGITKSWLSIINNFLLMVTKQTNNIHTYIHTKCIAYRLVYFIRGEHTIVHTQPICIKFHTSEHCF